MSFRGGGAGRGRGGGRSAIHSMGWEDTTTKLNSEPTELFPPYEVNVAAPPSDLEVREVAAYKFIQAKFHQSPLYTKPTTTDINASQKIYGEDQDNSRYASRTKANFDPFTGVPTYTQKYTQKSRTIPQLSGRTFSKQFFPEELWATIDHAAANSKARKEAGARATKTYLPNKVAKTVPSAATVATATVGAGGAMSLAERRGDTAKNPQQDVVDKLINVLDEEDEGEGEQGDEDALGEEEDYDYEDDEAEMGGDYDGEQYFDGGEDDDDGDGDGGGGDDY